MICLYSGPARLFVSFDKVCTGICAHACCNRRNAWHVSFFFLLRSNTDVKIPVYFTLVDYISRSPSPFSVTLHSPVEFHLLQLLIHVTHIWPPVFRSRPDAMRRTNWFVPLLVYTGFPAPHIFVQQFALGDPSDESLPCLHSSSSILRSQLKQTSKFDLCDLSHWGQHRTW